MRENDIQRMLEECIQGFDAGLTPDECLSAFPQARAELEPLFRQALSLRIAYSARPSEMFRERTREKLVFAAGRDVYKLFDAEPDAHFVSQTRKRLMNAAGAEAQEALRDVPPPRLPFWSNARRRMLETAAASPPRRASHAVAFGMRAALSAAVVTLAITIASAAFFISSGPANDQRMAHAELEAIERSFASMAEQWTEGDITPPGMLEQIRELAVRTSTLYEHLEDEDATLERLTSLIDRQQEFISYAESSGNSHPELASARELLQETEQKIGSTVAVVEPQTPIQTATAELAATEEPELPSPTPSDELATPEPTEPVSEPTEEPDPTATTAPVEPIERDDLQPNQILVQLDEADETLEIDWLRISTLTISFVVPDSWTSGLNPNALGVETLVADYVVFTLPQTEGPVVTPVVVSLRNGDVFALIDGEQHSLRLADEALGEEELASLVGEISPALYHFLTSIEVVE